jgi:hypothetical protein
MVFQDIKNRLMVALRIPFFVALTLVILLNTVNAQNYPEMT